MVQVRPSQPFCKGLKTLGFQAFHFFYRLSKTPPRPLKMLHLKQWKDIQTELYYALDDCEYTDYVFTQTNGKPIHPDSISCFFKRLEDKHHLTHINPHKFRHSQASIIINQGVDIVTVSKRLGHAKTSTTSDIYAHILRKSDEKASNVLQDVLKFKRP